MGLKSNEFKDKGLECMPKVVTVLNYLNQGREAKLGDFTFKIAETNGDGFNLVYKMEMTSSSGAESVEWYGYQGDLIHFSEMCNKLTEEEITIMQSNMALQAFNSINEREWL